MKLKFEKNETGQVSVTINDSSFETKDYIEMIKAIKKGDMIEVSCDENFTEEESANINSMFEKINGIKEKQVKTTEAAEEPNIEENLPF